MSLISTRSLFSKKPLLIAMCFLTICSETAFAKNTPFQQQAEPTTSISLEGKCMGEILPAKQDEKDYVDKIFNFPPDHEELYREGAALFYRADPETAGFLHNIVKMYGGKKINLQDKISSSSSSCYTACYINYGEERDFQNFIGGENSVGEIFIRPSIPYDETIKGADPTRTDSWALKYTSDKLDIAEKIAHEVMHWLDDYLKLFHYKPSNTCQAIPYNPENEERAVNAENVVATFYDSSVRGAYTQEKTPEVQEELNIKSAKFAFYKIVTDPNLNIEGKAKALIAQTGIFYQAFRHLGEKIEYHARELKLEEVRAFVAEKCEKIKKDYPESSPEKHEFGCLLIKTTILGLKPEDMKKLEELQAQISEQKFKG